MDKKELARQRAKQWYQENKERAKANSKAWAEANKDRVKAVKKAYRKKNAEEILEKVYLWQKNNPDKVKKHREAGREKAKKRTKEWRTKNPERARQAVNAGFAANPERANALARGYRARKRGAEGSHSADETDALCTWFGWRCVVCAEPLGESGAPLHTRHIDHVVPLVKGGSNRLANLQPLCRSCNCRKGGR